MKTIYVRGPYHCGRARARLVGVVCRAYRAGCLEFRGSWGRDAWGIVTPDACNPGRWRVTHYDRGGFSGHLEAPTAQAACFLLWEDGYTIPDPGSLDRVYAALLGAEEVEA